jgi:MarR family transcriptional regulator for hemolysin
VSRPTAEPIGLQLARTAKTFNRAFDDALSEAGGSVPTWLILLALKRQAWANQRELAAAVGIEGATLTHHLNGLERAGLVTRERDPANRRLQRVELTADGDASFHRMRKAATGFDARLRGILGDGEVDQLRELLQRLDEDIRG